METLQREGYSSADILGYDSSGFPYLCGSAAGTPPPPTPEATRGVGPLSASVPLPYARRGWETVPGVIRADGTESFRIEVDANASVDRVTIRGISPFLVPPSAEPIVLRDDGREGDRVAGDNVFTSGPFRYKTSVQMPEYYADDPDSPKGIYATQVGTISIEEADSVWTFSQQPGVGLLQPGTYVQSPTRLLSPDVAVSGHLVNLRSGARATQNFLRGRGFGYELVSLTKPLYSVLPDVFDFLLFLSTYRVESYNQSATENFIAGVHQTVRTNYTGTGQPIYDQSYLYGSGGKLLGVNALDPYDRGLYSNFATHEILHQWGAYMPVGLGLRSGAHYKVTSNVGSLLGGFQWVDDGSGRFDPDCSEGLNRASHASALDLYLMGLVDESAIKPLHVSDSFFDCSLPVFSYSTVTAEDLVRNLGERSPGPEAAQRSFRIGFVVETHDRLMTDTEMTFYEILAEHYVQPIPADAPTPYITSNWASISRFFGHGVTFRTDLNGAVPLMGPGSPGLGPLSAAPNPFRELTTLRCNVPAGAAGKTGRLQILDMRGRAVRTFAPRTMSTGVTAVDWDGRDDHGKRLSSGVYMSRLDIGGLVATGRIAKLE